MQQAIQLIESSERILLSGHLRADGDCLGAQSVMYHALRQMGKQVEVMLPNPPDGRYGFMQEHTPWTLFDGTLPAADLLLVCDCNQLSRLGAMGEAVSASPMPRIALDHHPIAVDHGWTALVHDETAAASGLMALNLAAALGVKALPLQAYEAAFVALMTDTGWLKYSNADAAAWAAAASLVEKGVDTERLYDLVYQQAEPGRPLGIRAALENLEYYQDGRIAIAFVAQSRLAQLHGALEDSDEILDILRGVAQVEAVGLITERPGGMVKVSFRSKRYLDVNQVARSIGGGGHARAAGASFPPGESLETAVGKVKNALLEGYAAQGVAAAFDTHA